MDVAFDTPPAGTVASATTKFGSAEAVRAQVIKAASINCPVSLGNLLERNLIIERIAPDGTVVSDAEYAMPTSGGRDRVLEFQIDVAILPGKAVRARIDQCVSGERQWVVINYDFVKV